MRKFNLEEALAGKPVITRDGRKVKIAGYNQDAEGMHKIVGWVDNMSRSWSETGIYNGYVEHSADIFMAPETKDVWVVLWSIRIDDYIKSTVYEDEEWAKNAAHGIENSGHVIYGIHKITITL